MTSEASGQTRLTCRIHVSESEYELNLVVKYLTTEYKSCLDIFLFVSVNTYTVHNTIQICGILKEIGS
jgi:hypothetical protein